MIYIFLESVTLHYILGKVLMEVEMFRRYGSCYIGIKLKHVRKWTSYQQPNMVALIRFTGIEIWNRVLDLKLVIQRTSVIKSFKDLENKNCFGMAYRLNQRFCDKTKKVTHSWNRTIYYLYSFSWLSPAMRDGVHPGQVTNPSQWKCIYVTELKQRVGPQ